MLKRNEKADVPRISQRAPHACLNCARRKVRCNKRTPCQNCIRRGDVSTCMPEVVTTRRNAQRPVNSQLYDGLHYDEIVAQNLLLQSMLGELSSGSPGLETPFKPNFTVHKHVARLFETAEENTPSLAVTRETDIIFPSCTLSKVLIKYAGLETSWNHFAVHPPTFQKEHKEFWEATTGDTQRAWYDASWLAVYFSLLSAVLCFKRRALEVDENGVGNQEALKYMEHWYKAAIFFLYKMDFIRVPNIRAVQAIAILGDVFVTVGEPKTLANLWPVAIRSAQSLGINDEKNLMKKSNLEAELSRRLWWNLVICDWLGVPFRTPCLHPDDFNVKLPSLKDDDELMGNSYPERSSDYPRPIHWQITMIRVSESYYTLHQLIRTGAWSDANATKFVFQTDEKIAKLISELPLWFSPDKDEKSNSDWPEDQFPWINAQRTRTYLMAYEIRINIYSLLLSLNPSAVEALSRARSIYLASSRTTLHLSLSLSNEVAKSWYNITNVYSAMMGIITESRRQMASDNFQDDKLLVHQGLDMLQSLSQESRIAKAAVLILGSRILGTEFSED